MISKKQGDMESEFANHILSLVLWVILMPVMATFVLLTVGGIGEDDAKDSILQSVESTQELALLINYYAAIDLAIETWQGNLEETQYDSYSDMLALSNQYRLENEQRMSAAKILYDDLLLSGQLDELKETVDIDDNEAQLEGENDLDDFYEENIDSSIYDEHTVLGEEVFVEVAVEEEVSEIDYRSVEYPEAYIVWHYLIEDIGLNSYAAAGVLGNMMAECGGQTLKLQPTVYSSTGTYYGICQWHKLYYSSVHGTDLTTQLNFLAENIAYEINLFGKNYRTGFGYEEFSTLTSVEAATLAFAKCYERCGSSSYTQRVKNAEVAYSYFS